MSSASPVAAAPIPSASYFYTDYTEGSMGFWDPENGVTTANSHYARSELRELNADGPAAAWSVPGAHLLSAIVKSTQIPDHVCVGQIHLGQNSGSTKPLLEQFYALSISTPETVASR